MALAARSGAGRRGLRRPFLDRRLALQSPARRRAAAAERSRCWKSCCCSCRGALVVVAFAIWLAGHGLVRRSGQLVTPSSAGSLPRPPCRCWLIPKLLERSAAALAHERHARRRCRRAARISAAARRWSLGCWSRFPGNQILQMAVQRKDTAAADTAARAGRADASRHLSDLHMTGQLGREFYDVVVDETNALNARPDRHHRRHPGKDERCLPWISADARPPAGAARANTSSSAITKCDCRMWRRCAPR